MPPRKAPINGRAADAAPQGQGETEEDLPPLTVGIIATRLEGTDGVSLETHKMAEVLSEAGHRVCYFAGARSALFQPGHTCPEAHFHTARNQWLEEQCFGQQDHLSESAQTVLRDVTRDLHRALCAFVEEFRPDLLITQNSLCIPMQLPLAVAITRLLRSMPWLTAIGHHHDFFWERERFDIRPLVVDTLLERSFPPSLPNLQHLVIHRTAQRELWRRLGLRAAIIPNVMDFENDPREQGLEGDGASFRAATGIEPERAIILHPTRVVPRKNIELSVQLTARLDRLCSRPVTLVVSHADGDEGTGYGDRIRGLAEQLDVDLRFHPAHSEGEGEQLGSPTLADAYAAADLVSYPSMIEGFGNAFLEAMYYRRPLLVNRYPVYETDIAPTGVKCIELEHGQLTEEALRRCLTWIEDPCRWREAVEQNFEIGRAHFSYEVLRQRLLPALNLCRQRTQAMEPGPRLEPSLSLV